MPVQILKLSNGETIIGDVLEVQDKVMAIAYPVEIRVEPRENGTSVMLGAQWLPITEDRNVVYINASHVIALQHANEDMQEFYVEAVEHIVYPERAEEKEKELYEKIQEIANMYSNTVIKNYH